MKRKKQIIMDQHSHEQTARELLALGRREFLSEVGGLTAGALAAGALLSVPVLAQDETARARYAEAAAQGDADIAVVFAGEGLDLIHAVEPAAAILARVVREAEAALARPLLTSA